MIGIGIGQFTLPGDNAGFCAAILAKNNGGAGAPLRLESLRYMRPAAEQQGERAAQQPLVVNLLMQLRAYHDENNAFLRNQVSLNLQLTNQLRQALSASSGPVRARAGEIERAVRSNLYRDGEFKRALESLARELKKNDNRTPELTVRLPGPGTAAAAARGQSAPQPPGAAAGTRPQATPVLRASVFPGELSRTAERGRFMPPPGEGGGPARADGETIHRAPRSPADAGGGPVLSGTAGKGRRKDAPAQGETPPQRKKQGGASSRSGAAGRAGVSGKKEERKKTAGHAQSREPEKIRADTTRKGTAPAPRPDESRLAAAARTGGNGPASGGHEGRPAAGNVHVGQAAPPAPADGGPVTAVLYRAAGETGGALARQPFASPSGRGSAGIFAARIWENWQNRWGSRVSGAWMPGKGNSFPIAGLWTGAAFETGFPPASAALRSASSGMARSESRPGGGETLPRGGLLPLSLRISPAGGLFSRTAIPSAAADFGGTGQAAFPPRHGLPLTGRSRPGVSAGTLFRTAAAPGTRLNGAGLAEIGAGTAAHLLRTETPPSGTAQTVRGRIAALPGETARPSPRRTPDGGAVLTARFPRTVSYETPDGGVTHFPAKIMPVFPLAEAGFGWAEGNGAAFPPLGWRLPGSVSAAQKAEQSARVPLIQPWLGRAEAGVRSRPQTLLRRSVGASEAWQAAAPSAFAAGRSAEGRHMALPVLRRSSLTGGAGRTGTALRQAGAAPGRDPAAQQISAGFPGPGRAAFPRRAWGTAPASGAGQLPRQADLHILRPAGRAGGMPEAGVSPQPGGEPVPPTIRLMRSPLLRPAGRISGRGAAEGGAWTAGGGFPAPVPAQSARPFDRGAASGRGNRDEQNRPLRQEQPARAAVIHRQPVRQSSTGKAERGGDSSGEEVLKAQTVSPAQAAALGAAYSYGVDPPRGGAAAAPITREQETRIAELVLEDLNYNRMAAEVLDRVERRLRAERRKFGR